MTDALDRQTAAQRLLAQRVLARRRLLYFTQLTLPTYQPGWVHDDIARRLERFSQAVEERRSPRLMLLCPPRTGKSELASIRYPAWHLGRCPSHEIINVGYNLDLPMRFSRKVRELLRDPLYQALFPQTRLDPESGAAEAWLTTAGGGLTAAGVGGGITGKGAHVLIIDDPVKNQEEADSAEARDKIDEWYQTVAYTRLAPGGGVLVIQCMTGDTPVLLPDGSHRRLDALRVGDVVATYDAGRLAASTVVAWKSSGRDLVYKITTSSGKVVRANGRHPFLAVEDGELKWIRTASLTTTHEIVAVRDSGENGKAWPAQQTAAANQRSAEGFATSTTSARSGPMGTARPQRATPYAGGLPTSSTGMASRLTSTLGSWLRRTANALFVAPGLLPSTGATACASTTATRLAQSAGFSATTATSPRGTWAMSGPPSRLPDTCDFTTERVVSVEPDGEEEVFDVQIDRTENFIANGLVSHNTRWNDDDLAGRLQQRMRLDPRADQFEVVSYPALAEAYEWRHRVTDELRRTQEDAPPDADAPALWERLRAPGEALHPDRYPTEALERIRANLAPRVWSALYQQNPVPDEGMYFSREYLRFARTFPDLRHVRLVTAWDFAIGEKQVNDWTVGATFALTPDGTLYLVDLVRLKGDAFAIVEAVLDTCERWGQLPETDYLLGFEDGQIFRALEPTLRQRMAERNLFRSYELLKPLTDKLARARVLQGRMQQGRVYLPEDAPWRETAVQELLRFPAGAHDDIVDAMAWAARLAATHAPPPGFTPVRLPSWRDRLDRWAQGAGSHMSA